MVDLKGWIVALSVALVPAGQAFADSEAITATQGPDVVVRAPGRCLPPPARAYADAPKPKVVSTFPSSGATVSPGILVLRVTFDVPMVCAGRMAGASPLPSPCSDMVAPAAVSPDSRTFWIACRVRKNTTYGLVLNGEGDSEPVFVSLAGKVLDPFPLIFETSSDAPVKTVEAALDRDPQTAAYLLAAKVSASSR